MSAPESAPERELAHDLVILARRGEAAAGEAHAGYALHGSVQQETGTVPVAWIFCSLEDAEELIVGRDVPRGRWRAARLTRREQVQRYVEGQKKRGFHRACVNPPPAARGLWRVVPIDRVLEWANSGTAAPLHAYAEQVCVRPYRENVPPGTPKDR